MKNTYLHNLGLPHYQMPDISLLNDYDSVDEVAAKDIEEEQNTNKKRIAEALNYYKIGIISIEVTVGPTISLYEIILESDVRISKIRNLEDDITLSLSALEIRIIAPMPGKNTIGFEVPNKNPQLVSMKSIIASKKFRENNYDLPVALGKTISNDIFMIDLCKMPHILVAGAIGQGKSVCLKAIITSLLYKKHPSQLKFVLIDPKKTEFAIYAGIENHFLAKLPDSEDGIVTDVSKVVQTLNSLTKEMKNRYDLLKKAQVCNVKEYNQRFTNKELAPEEGHRFLPYIVVIIDEFGDLIMTVGKEFELPIAIIAQLSSAVDIHMIITTQRPATNIITGTIKANFPARIAFKVALKIESQTILDCFGANQLIGRGDMLFAQGDELTRIQTPFIDMPEIESIVKSIEYQQGYPTAYYLPEYATDDEENDTLHKEKLDPLFREAAHLIAEDQRLTTSLIQRKFSIGYSRAARIVDQLEAAGLIGPFETERIINPLKDNESQNVDKPELDPLFHDAVHLVSGHQGGLISLIRRKFSIPYNRAARIVEQLEKAGIGPFKDNENQDTYLTKLDLLFHGAARWVVAHQHGSAFLIQRIFSIGYDRAGRIIDQLEAAGIIAPYEKGKTREVLVDDERELEKILSRMK